MPEGLSRNAVDLIFDMLQADPVQRPSSTQLLSYDLFIFSKQFDDKKVFLKKARGDTDVLSALNPFPHVATRRSIIRPYICVKHKK